MLISEVQRPIHPYRDLSPEEIEEAEKAAAEEEVSEEQPVAILPEQVLVQAKMNLILLRAVTEFCKGLSTPMKKMREEIIIHKALSAEHHKARWDREHKVLQNIIRFMIIRHMIRKFLEKKAAIEFQEKQTMIQKQFFHITHTPA